MTIVTCGNCRGEIGQNLLIVQPNARFELKATYQIHHARISHLIG